MVDATPADEWLTAAAECLADDSLPLVQRVTYAAFALAIINNPGRAPVSESEVGRLAGLSPHAARQALAGLGRAGLTQRILMVEGDVALVRHVLTAL